MFSCSPYSQWCTVLTKKNSLGRWSLLWLFSLFDWTQSRLIFFLAFCFLDSPCVMWSDKQLIQYTSCPLLAFLDGCNPPPEVDLGTGSSTSSSNIHVQPSSSSDASVEAEPPSELLDTSLESKQRARSSLIRLEPLTEAEASEETLFYLCKLRPAEPEANSTQLDKVWAGTELVTFMPHTHWCWFTTDYFLLSSTQYWHCVLILPHLSGLRCMLVEKQWQKWIKH